MKDFLVTVTTYPGGKPQSETETNYRLKAATRLEALRIILASDVMKSLNEVERSTIEAALQNSDTVTAENIIAEWNLTFIIDLDEDVQEFPGVLTTR